MHRTEFNLLLVQIKELLLLDWRLKNTLTL